MEEGFTFGLGTFVNAGSSRYKRDSRRGQCKEEEPYLFLDTRSIVLMLPRQGGVD